MPRRIRDEALTFVHGPCAVDWSIWFTHLSSLLTEFHDATCNEEDEETMYQSVLAFNFKIRSHKFTIAGSSNTCPSWFKWAEQMTNICNADKLGYIHRRFFSRSVTDERFNYSRWATVDASCHIIRQVSAAWTSEPLRPTLWSDQAHLVAACANLRLSTFHPSENISEREHFYNLIDKALALLDARDDSDIALKGARWLRSLTKNAKAKENVCLQRTLRNEVAEWPLRSDLKNEIFCYSQNYGTISYDLPRVPPEEFENWIRDADPNSQSQTNTSTAS